MYYSRVCRVTKSVDFMAMVAFLGKFKTYEVVAFPLDE